MTPLVLAWLFAAPPQSNNVIQGVVYWSNNTPIESAVVVLEGSCIETARETTTSRNGVYRFTNLPPCKYVIQVFYGYAEASRYVVVRGR